MQDRVERASFDVLHDEEQQLRRFLEGKDRRDEAVTQRGGDARLPPEPLHRRIPLEQRRGQHFDRDLLLERHIMGQIHEAHAAAAEHPDDLVFAERDLLEVSEQLGFRRLRYGSATAAAKTIGRE